MIKLYKSAVAAVVVGLTQFRDASAQLTRDEISTLQPNVTRLSFVSTRDANKRIEGIVIRAGGQYNRKAGLVKADDGTEHSLFWNQSDVRLADGNQSRRAQKQGRLGNKPTRGGSTASQESGLVIPLADFDDDWGVIDSSPIFAVKPLVRELEEKYSKSNMKLRVVAQRFDKSLHSRFGNQYKYRECEYGFDIESVETSPDDIESVETSQFGGIKAGDRILRALYDEEQQSIPLSKMSAMTEDDIKTTQNFLLGEERELIPKSGRVLFVVLRSEERCSASCKGVMSRLSKGVGLVFSMAARSFMESEHLPSGEFRWGDHKSLCKYVATFIAGKWKLGLICLSAFFLFKFILNHGSALHSEMHNEDNIYYYLPDVHEKPPVPGAQDLPASLSADEAPWNAQPVTDETTWWRIEKCLLVVCGVFACSVAFAGLIGSFEVAGRLGTNEGINFGSTLFIGIGIIGKVRRTTGVLKAFPNIPGALTFFVVQEIAVIGGSVLFGIFCGLFGLNFRPKNGVMALFYVCVIVGEVFLKCKLVTIAIAWYKKGMKTPAGYFETLDSVRKNLLSLNMTYLLVVFFSLHVVLDVLQQIVTASINTIAGRVTKLIATCTRRLCRCGTLVSYVESLCNEGSFAPLSVFCHSTDWILHHGLTIPTLRGQGLLYGVWDMTAERAAACSLASDMVEFTLTGNYKKLERQF